MHCISCILYYKSIYFGVYNFNEPRKEVYIIIMYVGMHLCIVFEESYNF